MKTISHPLDQVTLVTSADEIIGAADKMAAHRSPAQLHRAVSLWLWRINARGEKEVLFQQRSPHKIVGAGWWGNTLCGNVRPGESYQDCVVRRLSEELNIAATQVTNLKPLYLFEYQAWANDEFNEHELDQVWVGEYVEPAGGEAIQPNPQEVSAVLWLPLTELVSEVRRLASTYPSAAETIDMSMEELKEKTKPVTVRMLSQELVIVPWSILMLQDERLISAA